MDEQRRAWRYRAAAAEREERREWMLAEIVGWTLIVGAIVVAALLSFH